MRKEQRLVAIDFVSKLNEDDLRFLYTRLIERVSGDLAEVFDYLNKFPPIDSILIGTTSSVELYDLIDEVRDIVQKEAKKRKLIVYPLPPNAHPINE